MNAEEYVKERLQPEIDWYEGRSARNKGLHIASQTVEIICAAVIPLLAGYAKNGRDAIAIAIGILGAVVAISAGLSSVLKFQELWIKYRTTAESLKKEKYMFETGVEPYDLAAPLTVLVQRVETLVSQENTNWAQYMMKPGRDKDHA